MKTPIVKSVTDPLTAFEKIEKTIEGCTSIGQSNVVVNMIEQYRILFPQYIGVSVILKMKHNKKLEELSSD